MECAAFIWMEIHSPFLFPVCQFVEVILEYNGIFVRSNIPVENTIIRKESYAWLYTVREIVYKDQEQQGSRTVPWGTPLMTGTVSDVAPSTIIVSSILKHLDAHQILTDCQHGFRARRSCETQLLTLAHELLSSLDVGYQLIRKESYAWLYTVQEIVYKDQEQQGA
jgi:hypothetical protein